MPRGEGSFQPTGQPTGPGRNCRAGITSCRAPGLDHSSFIDASPPRSVCSSRIAYDLPATRSSVALSTLEPCCIASVSEPPEMGHSNTEA
ncbi:hypothetical protein HDA45_003279 [Amycolatopsis umgeniensis]|uniref:Uncharacterized protein n=1 Tax=Amycolatopsis umgeniensis TaxID=336628 RepID=A0A841B3M3_9PSEU|nr:hypothetical protein [Amycolatopsis umgeniensis]